MTQVFRRRAELGVKLVFLSIFLLAATAFAFLVSRARAYDHLGEPLAQPIPFSHKHHVGDDGIDCRYCHTTVENRPFAGLPASSVCMSCHSQLYTDAPVLAALRESVASGRPIAWQRVHYLPGFVYFDHSVHVAKGVACIECHGRVDQMPITWRVHPLEMQWCLACHRDPAPHLHPHADEFRMDLQPLSGAETESLAQLAHLQSQRRLTDCSTCHR